MCRVLRLPKTRRVLQNGASSLRPIDVLRLIVVKGGWHGHYRQRARILKFANYMPRRGRALSIEICGQYLSIRIRAFLRDSIYQLRLELIQVIKGLCNFPGTLVDAELPVDEFNQITGACTLI